MGASAAQPPTLANLPEELIESICSNLSKEEILQMSYVNHHIRRHTLPFLYRSIYLRFTNKYAESTTSPAIFPLVANDLVRDSSENQIQHISIAGESPLLLSRSKSFTPPILSLLRNILASSDLADHIQHISIAGKRSPLLFKSESPLTSEELDFMYQSFPEYCKRGKRGALLRENLEQGSTDAFCSLLISRLKNLETLEVGADFLLFSPFISDIIKASLESYPETRHLSGFLNLRKVVYSGIVDQTWHDHNCMDLEDILPFFYAPLIETIEVCRVGLGYESKWPQERPCTSSLQTLILHDTEIREEGLEFILQSAPKLRSFECHFVWRADSARQIPGVRRSFDEDVVCEKLQRAIDHVQGTLESLTLGQSYFGGGMQGESWYSQGVKGHLYLKDFAHLIYVESSPNLLLGPLPNQSPGLSAVLPSQITHLVIRAHDYYHWATNLWAQDNDLHIAEIAKYLENWKTHSPALKSVTSGQNYEDGGFIEEEEEITSKVRALCDNAGVKFDVKKTNTECGGYPFS